MSVWMVSLYSTLTLLEYLVPYCLFLTIFVSLLLCVGSNNLKNSLVGLSPQALRWCLVVLALVTGLPPSPLFFLKLKLLATITSFFGITPAIVVLLYLLVLWFYVGFGVLHSLGASTNLASKVSQAGRVSEVSALSCLAVAVFMSIFMCLCFTDLALLL